jgi:hypothetical protein
MVPEQNRNGEYSLSFSEEHEEYIQPCFVIPSLALNKWQENKLYMPGEIAGIQVNFNLEAQSPFFYIIKDERLLYEIRFQVLYVNTLNPLINPENLFYGKFDFEYQGLHLPFITPYTRFVIITPLDLLVMDELYRKHKACFVGLTPSFGKKIE